MKKWIVLGGLVLLGVAGAAWTKRDQIRGPWRRRPPTYHPKKVAELSGRFRMINVHEHIKSREVAPRLLRVMDDLNIVTTVLCAGSKTTTHNGKLPFIGWEENNDEVIEIARIWPDRFVPFVTIRPGLSDAVEQLKAWVKKGAKGLKLYSGHSKFHKLSLSESESVEYALDDPSMMPVYEWAEATQLPIVWHVNPGPYGAEFTRVMDRFPKLRVNCPHHCMSVGNLDRVREYLRKYPNLMMDTSHGYHEYMAGALRTIATHAEQFRALYAEFPDRFLWGTDVVVTDKKKKTPGWIKRMARSYFGLFEQAQFKLPIYNQKYQLEKEEDLPGLSLSEDFLRKMYEKNPRHWLKLDGA